MTVRQESDLRMPRERVVYLATVLVNLALFCLAIYLVGHGSAWLDEYPRLAKRAADVRGLAFALLAAPPALALLRNRRNAEAAGSGVRLSATQIPELYDTLVRFCERLGQREIPALYIAEQAKEPSKAFAAWNSHFIVIRPVFLVTPLEDVRPIYEFEIGRELGRIRLGHTQWWDELLVAYVIKLPLLRNPLLHARTYAHDRYAAYLAPDSARGLIVSASGRQLLKLVNVPEFIAQADSTRGFWPWLANLMRREPHVTFRIRALIESGLYDRADLAARVPDSQPARRRVATA
jgi:hypothetical protein